MARSTYIYLVGKSDDILAAFTVKREAYEWLVRSQYKPSQVFLSRMKDNPTDSRVCGTRESMCWDREDLISVYCRHHKMPYKPVVDALGSSLQYGIDELEEAILAVEPDKAFVAHRGGGASRA